ARLKRVDGRSWTEAGDGPPDFTPGHAAASRRLGGEDQVGRRRSEETPPPAPPHCGGEGSEPFVVPSPSQWGGVGGGAFFGLPAQQRFSPDAEHPQDLGRLGDQADDPAPSCLLPPVSCLLAYQPRSFHSGRLGFSEPIVLGAPCPG